MATLEENTDCVVHLNTSDIVGLAVGILRSLGGSRAFAVAHMDQPSFSISHPAYHSLCL